MIPSFRVLGVRIHAVQIPDATRVIRQWTSDRSRSRVVVVANAHVVNEARRHRSFARLLEGSDLSVPDGTPLLWVGRLTGFPMTRRVYGPELMMSVLQVPGLKHFLYGGLPGVAEELAKTLQNRIPGVRIVGTHSPGVGPLTSEEPPSVLERINRSGADVLWVALGAPKQEQWMFTRRMHLQVPVVAGVGAAFDFLTGRISQAPLWMQEHGLEWLFRLGAEPRRLWRRYLIQGSEFAVALVTEVFTGRYRRKSRITRG
jgi:N-acetylglucosaminyldiphosphoundecaprenol N-acetyl-beta-D-mannosaminyltransferase